MSNKKEERQEIERVPDNISFCAEEEKILALWEKLDAFQSCLKQSKTRPRFSFYDGPPFATGLPHYGHILAGTIKDIITRYSHQQGYHVERRFGWDCHGLPVEFEIDKMLGIKGPDDVAAMGIAAYNAECRKIVSRYATEWETIIGRMGRWIDFKNDYKTLYPWYMESIWWVFSQLYKKGLVYQGVKVMPFSTACNTPLSNFESGQNYKNTTDPAVVVSFPVIGDKDNASFIAWTTTPWTLPSNLALCVNPSMIYVKIKLNSNGKVYILMESRLDSLWKQGDYSELEKFVGGQLKGLKYEPLFKYFESEKTKGAFQILCDNYVTSESGTGVVHQAPYFGEDDFRVCLAAGIITRDQDPICPVDNSGKFMEPVSDFQGVHVKQADKDIIKWIKNKDRLVSHSQCTHSYPFCWRSDTPLIYKAVPSWFIKVEQMSEKLQQSSRNTYWVPDFVRDKRFGNWLKEARDWAISRNRYWGTPIPLWISEDRQEIRCVSSIAELEKITGQKITDLHRENIDHLVIESQRPGMPPLKRVSEVFDCWFESGSMPYAQNHYPFENVKQFEDNYPADFIAEGIDQTRGWFYTLIVISTALFGKPPFKNLIANGLILASDGQKMSKSKKNYPDPMDIVSKYGADALRLYLINSPVVRAENLLFKEEGVKDIIKDVFLPWYNAYRFMMQAITSYTKDHGFFYYSKHSDLKITNIMDRWILSSLNSLIEYIRKEMKLYHLYTVVPRLTKFIDNLCNWYVRMNRIRFKGSEGPEATFVAINVLFHVLFTMTKLMAPFTPFLTEYMYQKLKLFVPNQGKFTESIHYLMMPDVDSSLFNKDIERSIERMQDVVNLGRILRDKNTVPVKYPLPEIVILHHDEQYLDDIKEMKEFITSELNIKTLNVSNDKTTYGISMGAEPDHKILGARLKGAFKSVMTGIKNLSDAEVIEFMNQGTRVIADEQIDLSEIRLIYKTNLSNDNFPEKEYKVEGDRKVLILIDFNADESMKNEGFAREVVNRIQKLRKKAQLVPSDLIHIKYKTAADDMKVLLESQKSFIEETIKTDFSPLGELKDQFILIEETFELKGSKLTLMIARDNKFKQSNEKKLHIHLTLQDFEPKYEVWDEESYIIMPISLPLTFEILYDIVKKKFNLFYVGFSIWSNNTEVTKDFDLKGFSNYISLIIRHKDLTE